MHCETKQQIKPKGKGIKKLLLVGNPNVGKSVIFGFLTGQYKTFEDFAPDDFRRHAPRFQPASPALLAASFTARSSTCVIPDGIHTTILGFTKNLRW